MTSETQAQTLNVLDATGLQLGTIEADVFRSDLLRHSPGTYGWRAWEVLSIMEREEFGVGDQDVVRVSR